MPAARFARMHGEARICGLIDLAQAIHCELCEIKISEIGIGKAWLPSRQAVPTRGREGSCATVGGLPGMATPPPMPVRLALFDRNQARRFARKP